MIINMILAIIVYTFVTYYSYKAFNNFNNVFGIEEEGGNLDQGSSTGNNYGGVNDDYNHRENNYQNTGNRNSNFVAFAGRVQL